MPGAQTVTVVNKSGKIVSSGKHVFSVFKEARSAYRERKAEIKASRDADYEERRARSAMRAMTIKDEEEDAASQAPSRAPSKAHSKAHSKTSRSPSKHTSQHPRRAKTFNDSTSTTRPPLDRVASNSVHSSQDRPRDRHSVQDHPQPQQLIRRKTEADIIQHQRRTRKDSIDMDLAYGDLPDPLPVTKRTATESDLRAQVSKIQMLLDEANCLQHSAIATIESLQKNPDQLAAVALSLAEISNLATKMAPGVLLSLKGSFPAVIALLASPQFLIAGGVAVGVTVVALGGWKIIKKMQGGDSSETTSQRALSENEAPLILDELESQDLSRIELWRRGIADEQAQSAGTSVDGEFITPGASRFFYEEGVLDEDVRSRRSGKSRAMSVHSSRTDRTDRTSRTSRSHRSSGSARSKSESGETTKTKAKTRSRRKEPSGLRMLFKRD